MKRLLFIAGSFLLFGVGCSSPESTDSAALVDRLTSEIPNVVALGNAPSIQVSAIQGNKIIWSDAFGENTGVESIYMNASVQKTFTAAAVFQLHERQLVDLDADVQLYLPFTIRHPEFPDRFVTLRMLLSHRSGLGDFPHQFDWDTVSAFAPDYRPPCPDFLLDLSVEEFLRESLQPDGSNYDRSSWISEPGVTYRYSVSAYPLLRYLIGIVADQPYPEYMQDHIFGPLEMANTGFSIDALQSRHTVPHTRIDGHNIALPIWESHGWMMRTTAEDMAKFVLALTNAGTVDGFQLLKPETIKLMRKKTTHFKSLFKSSEDLQPSGHGLGLFLFTGGWFGNGGSAPGYQTLLRYNPTRQTGYVINSNVNAILGGGENYASARKDIYTVQDAMISILDPGLGFRKRVPEIAIIAGFVLYLLGIGVWVRRRRARMQTS